eukprot:TRINITY_DN62330_c0_g1_i1.p1 TRINITY_DN62330_c0_g1~~TRINITY_DN62330_c0_g1_i1.p1  ORF type:complete len:402 (+),score=98.57 TRINITY_DN62330_c0_g1_i1:66-1271(+)
MRAREVPLLLARRLAAAAGGTGPGQCARAPGARRPGLRRGPRLAAATLRQPRRWAPIAAQESAAEATSWEDFEGPLECWCCVNEDGSLRTGEGKWHDNFLLVQPVHKTESASEREVELDLRNGQKLTVDRERVRRRTCHYCGELNDLERVKALSSGKAQCYVCTTPLHLKDDPQVLEINAKIAARLEDPKAQDYCLTCLHHFAMHTFEFPAATPYGDKVLTSGAARNHWVASAAERVIALRHQLSGVHCAVSDEELHSEQISVKVTKDFLHQAHVEKKIKQLLDLAPDDERNIESFPRQALYLENQGRPDAVPHQMAIAPVAVKPTAQVTDPMLQWYTVLECIAADYGLTMLVGFLIDQKRLHKYSPTPHDAKYCKDAWLNSYVLRAQRMNAEDEQARKLR